MTTKQPPAQKHLARAREISVIFYKEGSWHENELAELISAALQQVESEALASKVVSEPELEIRKSLLRRIEYLESQLAPNEQVIRVPHMQKIEKAMGCYITIEQQELLEYILPEIKRLNPQARIEESNE